MHITTIRVRNWCQHSSLDIDLRAGLNGILGSNGHGKSNLLDAMRFAITGESINPGTKRDNLRWGQEKGWVEVTFMAGDTEYTIRRAIESAKITLKFADQLITKQAEAEEFLVKLFGANMRTLLDNVFIPQGKIDSILFARPSDRLKEFQQTFGLDQIAEAHKWLSQEANSYQVTAGIDEQLQGTVQLVMQARTDMESLESQISVRKNEITALEPAEQTINRALEATRTAEAIRQADKRVADTAAELVQLKTECDAAEEVLTKIRRTLEPMKPEAEQARVQIQQIEQAAAQYAQADATRTELAKAQEKLKHAVKPMSAEERTALLQTVTEHRINWVNMKAIADEKAPLPELPQQQAKQEEIVQLRFRIEHASKHLDLASKGQCPTCGQVFTSDLASLSNELAALKQALVAAVQESNQIRQIGLQAFKARVQEEAAALGTEEVTLARVSSEASTHDTCVRACEILTAQLQSAPQNKPDEAPLAALRGFLEQYQQLTELERAGSLQLGAVVNKRLNVADAHTDAEQFRDALGAGIDMPTQQEIETAKQSVTALALARTALSELGQSLGITQALSEQREAEVARLREILNREARDAAWVVEVRKARDILHVTNLPALMMREYARLLNIRIEHYLSVWESPFRMWLADDMSFRVRFEDGKELDAARLSGGQKIVASASFRLAMSDTFARSVGLLVFDEPSTYLDRENIQHLQTLLLKLKEMSQHSGRQILIVTHEESLMGFLDHVVEV